MSTFGGKIQEVPNISVDRFIGENVNSKAYFLSHCHTDHMQGLLDNDFGNQLVRENKYLYASEISCTILKRMYPFIENNLKMLELYIPHTISLTNQTFSVSLIPAGHCPGSVMFLFENDSRILYTGDYRIDKNDIPKFTCFYDTYNKVKVIDKIYLDTTFFLKKFFYFPKRKESLRDLCQIIEDWIQRGTLFYINLIISARYGYEYVFKEIFTRTGMPVHVCPKIFKFYSLIPELDSSVTLDGTNTRIHSNCNGWKSTCTYLQEAKIKNIKVSAFRWTQDALADSTSNFESEIHYVCYSTHASYEEGVALLRFLKPKAVEICVKHDDPHVNKEMSNLIQEHLNEFRVNSSECEVSKVKLFNANKKLKKYHLNTSVTKQTTAFEDLELKKGDNKTNLQLFSLKEKSKDKQQHMNEFKYGHCSKSVHNALKKVDLACDKYEEEDNVLYSIIFNTESKQTCESEDSELKEVDFETNNSKLSSLIEESEDVKQCTNELKYGNCSKTNDSEKVNLVCDKKEEENGILYSIIFNTGTKPTCKFENLELKVDDFETKNSSIEKTEDVKQRGNELKYCQYSKSLHDML